MDACKIPPVGVTSPCQQISAKDKKAPICIDDANVWQMENDICAELNWYRSVNKACIRPWWVACRVIMSKLRIRPYWSDLETQLLGTLQVYNAAMPACN